MIIKTELHAIIDGIRTAEASGKIPAFAYDRVSSDKQTDGISLAYQEKSAIDYALRKGLAIVHLFTVQESARREGRKVFNQMIDLALQTGVKHLIFKNTDRMSRNYADLVRLEKLIDEKEIHIHLYQNDRVLNRSINHNDRFLWGIEIAVAKQLSDKISHDGRENNRYKAGKGIAPGPSPFGYRYDREKKTHVIDPSRADLVRFIFDAYDLEQISIAAIAENLNARGETSSRGAPWTPKIVWKILTRTFYHGEFTYQGDTITGIHEPYYSKDRYIKRAARLGAHYAPRIVRKGEFLFSGMARCSCGRLMIGDIKKGRYVYYVHKCPVTKNQISIPETNILELFDTIMKRLRISIDESLAGELKSMFQKVAAEKTENVESERRSLDARLNNLKLKRQRLYDLYGDGKFDAMELGEQVSRINSQIRTLENTRMDNQEVSDKQLVMAAGIVDRCRKAPEIYLNSGKKKRAAIVRALIDHVIIDGQSYAVEWVKPLDSLLRPEIIGEFDKSTEWVYTGINIELVKKIALDILFSCRAA